MGSLTGSVIKELKLEIICLLSSLVYRQDEDDLCKKMSLPNITSWEHCKMGDNWLAREADCIFPNTTFLEEEYMPVGEREEFASEEEFIFEVVDKYTCKPSP